MGLSGFDNNTTNNRNPSDSLVIICLCKYVLLLQEIPGNQNTLNISKNALISLNRHIATMAIGNAIRYIICQVFISLEVYCIFKVCFNYLLYLLCCKNNFLNLLLQVVKYR